MNRGPARRVLVATRRGVYIDIVLNAVFLVSILISMAVLRGKLVYYPSDLAALFYAAIKNTAAPRGVAGLWGFVSYIRAPSLWVTDAMALAIVSLLAFSWMLRRPRYPVAYLPYALLHMASMIIAVFMASSAVLMLIAMLRWPSLILYADYVWWLNGLLVYGALFVFSYRLVPVIQERFMPPLVVDVAIVSLTGESTLAEPLVDGDLRVPLNHYIVVAPLGPLAERVVIRVRPKSVWRVDKHGAVIELHPVSPHQRSVLEIVYEYSEGSTRLLRRYRVAAEGVGEATIEFTCRVNRPTVHGVVEEYYDVYVTLPVTATYREAVARAIKELGLPADKVEVLRATVLLEGVEVDVSPDDQLFTLGGSEGLVSYIDILIRVE